MKLKVFNLIDYAGSDSLEVLNLFERVRSLQIFHFTAHLSRLEAL
jgi:hypothetical protein